jgi:rhodanese-related sulfurtransferase
MLLRRFMNQPDDREITNAEAAALYDADDAVFVDVREQDEWDEGHMPGAVHIPLGDLPRRGTELPADRKIVTVCRSGQRSLTAVDMLQELGYGDVKSMAGGMVEWAGNGREVE